MAATRADRFSRPTNLVPRWLLVLSSWSWRLVFVAAAAYVVIRMARMLSVLLIAAIVALLFTAILRPVSIRLRRHLPGPLSALLTILLAAAVLAGIIYFVVWRAIQGMPRLVDAFASTAQDIGTTLKEASNSSELGEVANAASEWLQRHRGDAVQYVSTGAGYVVHGLTALLLALFITFFLLYEAERIWRGLLRVVDDRWRSQVDRAGDVAWASITGYVRGTVSIAVIHGMVIGTVLAVLHTPLPASLALLVFLGSFVPLIGALAAGGLAVLITFTSQGWISAVILLGVLVLENQLEAHVLQPLIMGRNVQLHPLTIGVTVAAGTLTAGIFGAVIGVPLVAILVRAGPVLFGKPERADV